MSCDVSGEKSKWLLGGWKGDEGQGEDVEEGSEKIQAERRDESWESRVGWAELQTTVCEVRSGNERLAEGRWIFTTRSINGVRVSSKSNF